MEALKVKCPNCGQIRHETTEHYQPDQTPKGHFVRLIDPWKKWGWNDFDDEGIAISTTVCSMMTCPGCSAPLAPKGRLRIFVEPEKIKTQAELNQDKIDELFLSEVVPGNDVQLTPAFQCNVCGKICKSKGGLGGHMRSHDD